MVRDIEERIKAYHDKVVSANPEMPQGPCVKCLRQPDSFRLHDGRQRSFRFVAGDMVRVVLTILLRWKCPLCRGTFTDYPPFAVPYKRYVRDDIEGFSERYVETDQQTYRSVVRPEKTAVGYENDCQRQLDHSTVWKWLGWLGRLEQRLHMMLEWIRYQSPSHGLFRELTPIAPKKYRSERRKRVLEQARLLLRAAGVYQELSLSKTFPGLETRCLRF